MNSSKRANAPTRPTRVSSALSKNGESYLRRRSRGCRREREQLPKDIDALKDRVGYTAHEASKQKEMDLETPTNPEGESTESAPGTHA